MSGIDSFSIPSQYRFPLVVGCGALLSVVVLSCCGGTLLYVTNRDSGNADVPVVETPPVADEEQETEHRQLCIRVIRRMQRDGWTPLGNPMSPVAASAILGEGVTPPRSKETRFESYVQLGMHSAEYIRFAVHEKGHRLSFRQIDEPYRLAGELTPDFPLEEWRLIDDMLRAAERAYQRDVLGSTEADLEGEFRIVHRETSRIKGERVGEPDYWRYDVHVRAATDRYEIEASIMEEHYEHPRIAVIVELTPVK